MSDEEREDLHQTFLRTVDKILQKYIGGKHETIGQGSTESWR